MASRRPGSSPEPPRNDTSLRKLQAILHMLGYAGIIILSTASMSRSRRRRLRENVQAAYLAAAGTTSS